jgi:hypothetical protein
MSKTLADGSRSHVDTGINVAASVQRIKDAAVGPALALVDDDGFVLLLLARWVRFASWAKALTSETRTAVLPDDTSELTMMSFELVGR